jgi:hypothetical protein
MDGSANRNVSCPAGVSRSEPISSPATGWPSTPLAAGVPAVGA